MKRFLPKLAILAVLTFSLSGCFLKSVHPLFTSEDAVLLEELDGTYENENQRWTFASDQNPVMVADLIRKYPSDDVTFDPGESDSLGIKGYLIMYEELDEPEKKPVLFLGTVGEIDDAYYLNLKLFEIDFGFSSDPYLTHKFNVNTFSRITLEENQLAIEHLESEWISEQIVNNRVRIKHEIVYSEYDDSREILVTASTDELQKFIEKYGNEPEAYQDAITLEKVNYEAP